MKGTKRGFTLVEVLVGAIIMTIVIGGVSFGISAALKLYEKANAQSVVINGLRFTVDSYNRKVVPMLHTAYSIDVQQKIDSDISTLDGTTITNADEHYLYLKGKALTLKSQSGTETLNGSDYITGLQFALPTSTDETGKNYLLDMNVSASYTENETVTKSLDVKTALLNKPEKIAGHLASGNVLHFYSEAEVDTNLGFVWSLDLYLVGTHRIINKMVNIPKSSDIRLEYSAKVKENGNELSADIDYTFQWYVATSSDFTDQEKITSAASATTATLKTSEIASLEKSYARCLVVAQATLADGRTATGQEYSPYVAIAAAKKSDSMWDDWLKGKENFTDTSVADDNKFKITRDVNSGQMKMTIKANSTKAGAGTIALLDYKYFDNDMIYEAWSKYPSKTDSDVPSFMTMTNYSVIIDFQAQSNIESVWFFLSESSGNEDFSTNTRGQDFKDIGYAVEYNLKNDGFAVQLRQNAQNDSQSMVGSFGVTADNGDNYYETKAMFNKALNTSSNRVCEKWSKTARHRMIFTVLEYYTDSIDKPKYLIRAKLLKDKSTDESVLVDDPWCMGYRFFLSEPAWFGSAVGNELDHLLITYKAPVKHFVTGSGNNANPKELLTDSILYFPWLSEYYYNKFYGTQDISSGNNDNRIFMLDELAPNVEVNPSSNAVLKVPARERYVGLFANLITGRTNYNNVTFYEVRFAPGFTADEIKSIMPENGKMYEIQDTVQPSDFSSISNNAWYKTDAASKINKTLFGERGKSTGDSKNVGSNGKSSIYYVSTDATTERYSRGVYGLQHVPGINCDCPLHRELSKWSGPASETLDPYAVVNAINAILHDSNSATYNYFVKLFPRGSQTLNSTGVNYADAFVAEMEQQYGMDLAGTSWRIYRRVGEESGQSKQEYNIFWTATDISNLSRGTKIENVYRYAAADDPPDRTIQISHAFVDIETTAGITMKIIRNWGKDSL